MKLNMKIVITLLLLISLSSLVKGACNDLQKERCKKIFNIKKLSDVHCSASSGSNNGIGYACSTLNKNNIKCDRFQDKCSELCQSVKLEKVKGKNQTYCNNKGYFCSCHGELNIPK